jgi:hypothetical protein
MGRTWLLALALLPCRFQLVYACGAAQGLTSLQERVHVVQALLQLISQPSAQLQKMLKLHGVAVFERPSR